MISTFVRLGLTTLVVAVAIGAMYSAYGRSPAAEAAPSDFDDTQWPTVGRALSSPFGPRLQASEGFLYDYHRGIDIPGDLGEPIVALADGEVYRTYFEGAPGNPYPDGGTVVVLRHIADQPIPLHGGLHTIYYSLYLHLDSIVEELVVEPDTPPEERPQVSGGDVIGTLGQTGGTTFDHLHFEIRVGTTCSREFQIANPESSCASYFGETPRDPHINPTVFLGYIDENATQIEVLQASPLQVRVTAPRSELDLDEIRVVHSGGEKVVNFNHRTGIDPLNIDNPDYDGVLISPAQFNTSSPTYEITFEFAGIGDFTMIEARDIWGDVTSLTPATVPSMSWWGLVVGAVVFGVAGPVWYRRRVAMRVGSGPG